MIDSVHEYDIQQKSLLFLKGIFVIYEKENINIVYFKPNFGL